MDTRLSSRLARIRAAAGSRPPVSAASSARVSSDRAAPSDARPDPDGAFAGWENIGPFVKKRTAWSDRTFGRFARADTSLAVICSGAARVFAAGPVPARGLLLFDLETTGLSGGAGTVAFLAAFGRFLEDGAETRLEIVQYLLLDYPGEGEFLELVKAELEREAGGGPVLVSYNGRTFDSQILRTRFLMNAMPPLDPPHLDLVYPARRLWRRGLENCTLGNIERSVLGIERTDDLPGSEAPDAWFSFLRTGGAARLERICAHNFSDLEGLAALLVKIDAVARDPLGCLAGPAGVDAEALGLRYLAAAKAEQAAGRRDERSEILALELLEAAVRVGSARAAFALAGWRAASGDHGGAAGLRAFAARSEGSSSYPPAAPGLRAAACRLNAADAKRRLADPEAAAGWLAEGLAVPGLPDGARRDLERLRAASAPGDLPLQ